MLSYINERNVERMIDAKNAEITRKINGDYTLSFIAIDEPDLLEELIVICEGQKYRIKQLSSTMNGNKTLQSVTCKHISFDLIDYYAYDYLTNTVTLDKALQFLFKGTPFTYSISDSIKNQSFEKLGECNKQKLLAKIIEAYGLEYEVDNYHFTFKKKVGYETEFQFRYKANISNVKKDIDTTALTTYIKGYGKKDDEGNYLCTAEYTSPNAEKFGVRHADPVFDERFTIQTELLEYIKTKINDTPDIVVELDYTQIDATQPINLGDYGYLIHEPLQLDLLSRVVEITKKLSTDRQGNNYQNMTYKIGSQKLVKSSFETSKDSITGSIDIDVPDVVVPDVDYDRIQAEIEAGKQEATDKINSGLGGYVTKTRNELLIMDTEDKATARHLWRWNINGLGFSSNGYSGPYATAITNDGKINADRILVGTLDGALIRANTIKANSLEISTVQKINAAITADDATAIMNTRLEVYDGNIKAHINTITESKKTEAINSANQNTATVIANYYTKSETDSAISVAKDEISLGVSNKYETKANVETKVSSTLNSAKSYADTKKTEAINTASTDATSKVNAAKSELNTAIGKKANTVDVYSKAEVYTKGQTDSAIKVAKDEINLGVSNTYETKANVETKVTTAVNNIKIGAANLLPNTKTLTGWTTQGMITTDKVNGFTVYRAKWVEGVDTGGYKDFRFNGVTAPKPNTQYTLSFWAKGNGQFKSFFYPNTVASGINSQGNKTTASDGAISFNLSNTYTKYWVTWTTSSAVSGTKNIIVSRLQSVAEVFIYGIKLEEGNKATDWTPAPVDITTDITTAKTEAINTAASDATNKANNAKNEAITSANNTLTTTIANYYTKAQTDSQINVAKDAITSSVSSTYATKTDVTSSINGVNSSISSLQTRMNTAESKITDTAITNTVKKNFYTKTETENAITSKEYATQSQVQQTVDNLQIKFTQSGGYNLFLNSGFKKGTSYWGTHTYNSPTGGSIGTITSTGDWGFPDASVNCAQICLANQSGIEYGISQSVKTTISKKYTISFYYAGHRLNQANLIVRNSNGSWLASKAITSFPSGGNGNANNWSKHTLTFTANATSHSINIVIASAGDDGYMWVAKPQVVEGELDLPYSPHPSEVYDGLTQIDKDGVTVTSSNVNSKTKMSADGFQLIRTTDNKKMFYVNQDGSLEMSGNFTQHDSNGKISIKIANNSYGCYDWLWDGDFVGNFGAFESNRTNTSGANQRFIGIANIADYGNQLILGVRSSPNSTNFNSYIEIDNTTLMHRDYVTFTANTGFKTNAIFRNPSNNNSETGRIFGATNNHFFVACNYNNQLRLGYEKNGSYYPGISIYRNDNTSAGCAIEYYADEVHHNNVVIDGFLSVKGQKNRLVATENFGDRLLNAYETAECYFGDINETIIGEDGEVKVELDEVFLETVNTTEPYQVFLTKYGEGDCYVSERHEKYFVIKGTPNLSVGFEVKAKQRGYEKERLKMTVDTLNSPQTTSLEDEAGYTIDCVTTINRG